MKVSPLVDVVQSVKGATSHTLASRREPKRQPWDIQDGFANASTDENHVVSAVKWFQVKNV